MGALSTLIVTGEVNDVVPDPAAIWRLAAAALLGAIVGFEREVDDQPAGLRTHLTVALGAAVFGVISTLGFSEFIAGQRDVNIQFDVTRVASQVVVGVGFLGAGVIFRAGDKIRNLTTAASLWVTAGIGLAAGVGDIGVAVTAAIALLVALLVLRIPRDLVRSRITRRTMAVSLRLRDLDDASAVLTELRALDDIEVVRVGWAKRDGFPVLDVVLRGEPTVEPASTLRPIVERDEVLDIQTQFGIAASAPDGEGHR